MTRLAALTLAAFALTACQSLGSGTGAGTADGDDGAGMLLADLLGGALGGDLDRADRRYAGKNAQHTLESVPIGTTREWRNPDSDHHGSLTPTRTYPAPGGSWCREFQQTLTVEGKTEKAYGTACQGADGSWKIVP